jgi:hypothetical protein
MDADRVDALMAEGDEGEGSTESLRVEDVEEVGVVSS